MRMIRKKVHIRMHINSLTDGVCLDECYAEFKGPRNIPLFKRLEAPVVKIEDYFIIGGPTRAQLENLARTWLMQHPVIGGIYLTHSFINWTRKDCYFPQGDEHDYLLDGNGNKQKHALLLLDSKSTTGSLQFWAKNSYGENWVKNTEDDAIVEYKRYSVNYISNRILKLELLHS